jgi:hypothetical protein
MKMYCATTAEVDDAESAVTEILEQLTLEENLLENAIGLIAMFGEFHDTGVYSAVVNALPFPCIGYSSSFMGSNGESGDILMSVVVMTSDENEFEIFKLDYIDTFADMDGTKKAIEALAADIYSCGKPSLIMPYWGVLPRISSDDMLTLINEAFRDTPLYGSVIFSSDSGQIAGFTCIGDGEKLYKEAVFVAVYGDLKLHFMVVSGINESVKLRNPAKVTKAVSSTLYEVNNITLRDYLVKIGVFDDSFNTDTMWVLPALIEDKEHGISKARAFVGISPDCPTAFYASGNLEEGSLVTFGQLDCEATNESAKKAFYELVSTGANCFLGVSCVARSWANGTEYLKEFKEIGSIYDNMKASGSKPLNYQIINSGGEICPVPDKNGKLVNTLHNYSLAICYFKD